MEAYQDMPLESAISAVKAVTILSYLLYMAVIVFLIGFGLYVLFQWLEDVGGAVLYRNIFIVFIITAGIYAAYDALIEVARVLDRDKRSREFKINMLGGSRKQKHRRTLQQSLLDLRQRVEDEDIEGEDQDQPGTAFQSRIQESLDVLTVTLALDPTYSDPLRQLLRLSSRSTNQSGMYRT
jgi:hypothetical protein